MTHTETPTAQRVLFLCVNYGSDAETLDYAQRALQLPGREALRVVVVDNTPRDHPGHELEAWGQREERGMYLVAPENLGYFGAAAYGLDAYLQDAALPDWTIVCNTDIEFPDCNFVLRLLDYEMPEDAAVLAPSIFSTLKHHDQNPHIVSRPSRERMQFWRKVASNYNLYSAYQLLSHVKGFGSAVYERLVRRPESREASSIYAPHGAFICFHRRYFDNGGTLRYGGFLFGEEIFVGETVREMDLHVRYDPALRVEHAEHQTTGGKTPWLRSRNTVRLVFEGRDFLTRTYFAS